MRAKHVFVLIGIFAASAFCVVCPSHVNATGAGSGVYADDDGGANGGGYGGTGSSGGYGKADDNGADSKVAGSGNGGGYGKAGDSGELNP